MIIGICAKKQCGKDSMAGFIQKQLPDKKIQQISFAKPLKDFINEVLNVPKKNVWGTDADKNYPLCTWGEVFEGPALVAYKKRDRDLLSAREILQILGTDVMRYGHIDYVTGPLQKEVVLFLQKKFGAGTTPFLNIWVDLAIMDIKVMKTRNELDIAVISDVRFHNEVAAVKKSGGKMVRLYRDTKCADSIPHPSELEMEDMRDADFDFVLPEEYNINLKQLAHFTTKVLMGCGLIETGGLLV